MDAAAHMRFDSYQTPQMPNGLLVAKQVLVG
jgi:hypothetical protein